MTVERSQIREGMTVHSADGQKLGKVLTCDALTFIVERGFFFPKDYVARYEDVAETSGNDVRLSAGQESLRSLDEIQGAPDVGAFGRRDEASRGGEPAVGASAAGPSFGAEPRTEPELEAPVAAQRADAELRQGPADEDDLRRRLLDEPGAFTRDDPDRH
jgi:hypothetical protein